MMNKYPNRKTWRKFSLFTMILHTFLLKNIFNLGVIRECKAFITPIHLQKTSYFTAASHKNHEISEIVSSSAGIVVQELRKSQSKNDLEVQNWFSNEAGIVGTSQLCLSTTSKSVGGRGVFWAPVQDDEIAYQGDVLAFIPSKSILTESNLKSCFLGDTKNQQLLKEDQSLQAKITLLSCNCLRKSNMDDLNRVPWIQSWKGRGGPPAPKPLESYSDEELQHYATICNTNVELVKKIVNQRYVTFQRDLQSTIHKNYEEEENENNNYCDGNFDEFGEMYSIVVSRTASLGPLWNNERGIIPLHDFINHPPPHLQSNVELFCFGDLCEMIGYNHTSELLDRMLLRENSNIGNHEKNKRKHFEPKDDDVLLVASSNINVGQELWLSYRNHENIKLEEEKVWLMLQYGFPLHL